MTSPNSLLKLPVQLVLASQSPRRRQLLEQVGFEFTAIAPNINEDIIEPIAPFDQYVQRLAELKAAEGLRMVDADAIVIGSDTTVVLDDKVLNKPSSKQEACEMLHALSGRTHVVYTGLALAWQVAGVLGFAATHSATQVTFRELSSLEIDAYVEGGSPMDKAGAYGIQDDFGAVFVQSIHGCYYTVVGLPIEKLYTMLRKVAEQT